MKLSKLILTGVFATTLMGASFAANTVESRTSITVVKDEQAPKEIKVSELPQAVQESLKAANCEADKAYLMESNGEIVYQVEAKKEGKKITLMYDENGEEVKNKK